jgi:hypothetical protein
MKVSGTEGFNQQRAKSGLLKQRTALSAINQKQPVAEEKSDDSLKSRLSTSEMRMPINPTGKENVDALLRNAVPVKKQVSGDSRYTHQLKQKLAEAKAAEQELAEAKATINTMSVKLGRSETEQEALVSNNAAMASENAAIASENAAIASENAAIASENASLTTENTSLTTENAAMVAKLEKRDLLIASFRDGKMDQTAYLAALSEL